jgi:hypothetical protein
MRRNSAIMVFVLVALVVPAGARASRAAQGSPAADPVIVRIEGSVILQSQMSKLAALQMLTQGVPDSRDRLIQELIEQWIVMSDAKGAGFPEPSAQLVDVEEAKVTDQLGGSEAYAAKLRELGIPAEDVRQLLSRQVLIERYLDHKFRPTVQIGESDIEMYYQKEWLPALARENESAVPLDEVQDRIREVLTQQEVRTHAAQWISGVQSHLKIEQVASTSAT